jgi:hypothetical protein
MNADSNPGETVKKIYKNKWNVSFKL